MFTLTYIYSTHVHHKEMKLPKTRDSYGFSLKNLAVVKIILGTMGDSKVVKDHFSLTYTKVCGQDLKEVITYMSK